MKLRLIYILSLIMSFAVTSKAQTTFPTPEVFFQEDDTIDIYANESVSITNRIESEVVENIKWEILLTGHAFDYTTGPYKDGSFTFTPPNESVDYVKTYDFTVNVKKIREDDSVCMFDTTKVFHIRVFPKPYSNVIARLCTGYNDETGYTAIFLKNKASCPDSVFQVGTFATHVLRLSVPSVSNNEECWQWSVRDSVRNAGVGHTCKFRFAEEDGSEDGTVHYFKIHVRNKLPYRKEAFEDDYELECKVFPIPDAGVCEHLETYSGHEADFGLSTIGGIKGAWGVFWTDSEGNELTEDEMHHVCKYVDEPTEFRYRVYIKNGNDLTGYYHGTSYPILKVWKAPKANICDLNGKDITEEGNATNKYTIDCVENDSISIIFKVDGGYEADDSWSAFVDSTSLSYSEDNIVTCKYKINVSDSLRAKANKEIFTYPLHIKVQNRYTGEYSSPDSIWFCDSVKVMLNVRLRPLAPTRLIKKGNGNSCTVIATINANDPYTHMANYRLVYGYEKEDGSIVEHPSVGRGKTYEVFSKTEFADKTNRFFVYAVVLVSDSYIVISDKCYMNDEETTEETMEVREYDMSGRATEVTRGFVITRMSDGTTRKTIKK